MLEIDDIEKTIYDIVLKVARVNKISTLDQQKLTEHVGAFLIEETVKSDYAWSVQNFAMHYACETMLQKNMSDNYSSRFDLFDCFKRSYKSGCEMGGEWRQELYQGLSHKSSTIATAGTSFLTPPTPKR